MNKQILVSLVAEYDDSGVLFWHIISSNLRIGDIRYELVGAPPDCWRFLDAYWTKPIIEGPAKRYIRQHVKSLPTTALRPPSPEEVSRRQDILE